MEFKLGTNLDILPFSIDFNYQEIKNWLSTQLDDYRGILVTDQSVAEVKRMRADLSALRTRLDSERKKIKAACMLPYKSVETKIKDLRSMIGEVIGTIDDRISAVEENRKKGIYEKLYHHWNSLQFVEPNIISFEQIFNQRWLNKTYGLSVAISDISETVKKINADISIIKSLASPFEQRLLQVYQRDMNLYEVMEYSGRLEEPVIYQNDTVQNFTAIQQNENNMQAFAEADETIILEITLKSSQKSALGKYFRQNNIMYRLYEK
ncbi:MAG: DUF1351 domain-containing protein [Oscillospiraceae bacterium]|jgi:hypothetical protein|nr:DUF1351 domain-containing protein [Oscillospiraceae bacterium]